MVYTSKCNSFCTRKTQSLPDLWCPLLWLNDQELTHGPKPQSDRCQMPHPALQHDKNGRSETKEGRDLACASSILALIFRISYQESRPAKMQVHGSCMYYVF